MKFITAWSVACLFNLSPLAAQQSFAVEITGMSAVSTTGQLDFSVPTTAPCGTYQGAFGTWCTVPWSCAPGDTDLELVSRLATGVNASCSGIATAQADGNVLRIQTLPSAPTVELMLSVPSETFSCGAPIGGALPLYRQPPVGPVGFDGFGCTINNLCNGVTCDETAPPIGGYTFRGGPVVQVERFKISGSGSGHPTASLQFELVVAPTGASCPPAIAATLPASLCSAFVSGLQVSSAHDLAALVAADINACSLAGVSAVASGSDLRILNDPALSGSVVDFGLRAVELETNPGFYTYGLPPDCVATNLLDGEGGNEGTGVQGGYAIERLGATLGTIQVNNGLDINLSLLTAPRAVLGEPWFAQVTVLQPSMPASGTMILLGSPNCLTTGTHLSLFGGPITQLLVGPTNLAQPCGLESYVAGRGHPCAGFVFPNDCAMIGFAYGLQALVGDTSSGFVFTNALCGTVGTH